LVKLLGTDESEILKILEQNHKNIIKYDWNDTLTTGKNVEQILGAAKYNYRSEIQIDGAVPAESTKLELIDYDKLKSSMDKAGLS